jgi:hypothetical protein
MGDLARERVPEAVRQAIITVYKGRCQYCRAYGAHHIDHIKPVADDGPSELWNLTLACERCNLQKGAIALPRGYIESVHANAKKRQLAVEALIAAWRVPDGRSIDLSARPRPISPAALAIATSRAAVVRRKPCYVFSGWGMVRLPHRSTASRDIWRACAPGVELTVEGGPAGVPYGSRARLILTYLETVALRTRSQEVLLGLSLRQWMLRMGISIGGKTVHDLLIQLQMVQAAKVTFQNTVGLPQLFGETIVSIQGHTARLSDAFYEALVTQAIAVDEEALVRVNSKSRALDAYVWLAGLLPHIADEREINWYDLYAQFGAGFQLIRKFRSYFAQTIAEVLAIYPDANVETRTTGILLRPSLPPLPPRLLATPWKQISHAALG